LRRWPWPWQCGPIFATIAYRHGHEGGLEPPAAPATPTTVPTAAEKGCTRPV